MKRDEARVKGAPRSIVMVAGQEFGFSSHRQAERFKVAAQRLGVAAHAAGLSEGLAAAAEIARPWSVLAADAIERAGKRFFKDPLPP